MSAPMDIDGANAQTATLEVPMKPLPKELDEIERYLQVGPDHIESLKIDLDFAKVNGSSDEIERVSRVIKVVSSNLASLRRLKGKKLSAATKAPPSGKTGKRARNTQGGGVGDAGDVGRSKRRRPEPQDVVLPPPAPQDVVLPPTASQDAVQPLSTAPPATQQVAPPSYQDVPSTEQVVPPSTQQVVVPPSTQDAPSVQRVVPPSAQQVVPPSAQQVVPPSAQQVVPPSTQQGVVPPSTQDTPSAQQVVPPSTQQVVVPPSPQDAPSAQQVIPPSTQQVVVPPSTQDAPSAQQVIPPSTQQVVVPPSTQDAPSAVPPSAQQVIPPSTQQVVVPPSTQDAPSAVPPSNQQVALPPPAKIVAGKRRAPKKRGKKGSVQPPAQPLKSGAPSGTSKDQDTKLPNPATVDGMLTLQPDSSEEDDEDDAAISKPHFPCDYTKLDVNQREEIHTEAKDDFRLHRVYNTPLSHSTRTWIRRGQPVLKDAGSYSQKLASSVFILSNGRTVCHYHTVYDHRSLVNDTNSKPKRGHHVTGVPWARDKNPLRHPSYLERPRVDANGNPKVPNPTSYNNNFTLSRVLEFFPVDDGIRRLHCGCDYEDVLTEFYFWKRVQLVSPTKDISEGYGKPMKPRDRAYLCAALCFFNLDLTILYRHDSNHRPISEVTRLERLIDEVQAVIDSLKKKSAQQGAGKCALGARARARAPAKTLEYREISDIDADGEVDNGSDSDPEHPLRSPNALERERMPLSD